MPDIVPEVSLNEDFSVPPPPGNASGVSSKLRYHKRDGVFEVQDFADPGLAIVSQQRGVSLQEQPGFVYDTVAGKDVTVYVIDQGVDITNSVRTPSSSSKD